MAEPSFWKLVCLPAKVMVFLLDPAVLRVEQRLGESWGFEDSFLIVIFTFPH
jgi:hypothetical protein